MSTRLLDIHPRELKFTYELKKQSSCAVQLLNISDHYVAFKVKTTSPKKYCVRPNTGIINPRSKCDFTVTMQAQRSAPPDLHCKDKFLVQSTVVPFGTTEDDITPGMFAKDSGKHIEDSKLSVVLISPAQSPVLLPINGVMKQESQYGISIQKEKLQTGVENPPLPMLPKHVEDVKSAPVMESRFVKYAVDLSPSKSAELSPSKAADPRTVQDVVVELRPSKGTEPREVKDEEDTRLKLGKDKLKSELTVLQSKLSEAGFTIARLTKERNTTIQEKETLKHELAQLRRRRVHVGFPFLFVCMVALIGLTLGYLLRWLTLLPVGPPPSGISRRSL